MSAHIARDSETPWLSQGHEHKLCPAVAVIQDNTRRASGEEVATPAVLTIRFALKSSPEVPAGRVVPSSGSTTTLNESGMRSSPRRDVLRVIDINDIPLSRRRTVGLFSKKSRPPRPRSGSFAICSTQSAFSSSATFALLELCPKARL